VFVHPKGTARDDARFFSLDPSSGGEGGTEVVLAEHTEKWSGGNKTERESAGEDRIKVQLCFRLATLSTLAPPPTLVNFFKIQLCNHYV